MKAKFVNETLSAQGAVLGFVAWLTARKKRICMSAKDDATEPLDLAIKFIKKQKLEKENDNWVDDMISMNETNKLVKESLNELTPFGFYDMCNSLDITKAVIPELRKEKINFIYDAYANFLTISAKNYKEAKTAERILLYSGEGDKGEGSKIYTDDAAVITW